jgi:hypothetical protein
MVAFPLQAEATSAGNLSLLGVRHGERKKECGVEMQMIWILIRRFRLLAEY